MTKATTRFFVRLSFIVVQLVGFSWAYAQEASSALSSLPARTGDMQLEEQPYKQVSQDLFSGDFLDKIVVAGYMRGYGYNRKLSTPYDAELEAIGQNKVMGLWDEYYDPFLFLYVGGDPTRVNSFGTEIILRTNMDGPGYNENLFNIFNAMAVRGNIATGVGQFSIITGGIEWRSLTPFTFGQNLAYQRFSLFERRPWDPVDHVRKRYSSYFHTGELDQSVRFANRAFKGFMIHGHRMPYNLTMDLFYGKTMHNAGFAAADITRPSHNLAMKVNKQFNVDNRISFNTFHSRAHTDSVRSDPAEFQMWTTEFDVRPLDFHVKGEVGVGSYESPNFAPNFDPAAMVDITLPEKWTKVPLTLRGYHIQKNFVNRNGSFQNATIDELNTGFMGQGAAVLSPSGNQMLGVGGLVNNREGANVNTEIRLGPVKIQLGNEISRDIENLSERNTLTYMHTVNGLTWSRFKPFPNPLGPFGPNNRVETVFRGAYEIVTIDSAQEASSRMHYNASDIQIKLNQKIGKRNLYIFSNNSFSSAQPDAALIPKTTEDAYIRMSNHELDVFMEVTRDLILDFYLGYERVKGNQFTDTELNDQDQLMPRDQTGRSIGIGFDYALSAKAYLFFRQRWFDFEDKNFANEIFKGHEATVELKMFF